MKRFLKKLMFLFLELEAVHSYVIEGFEIRVFYFKGILTWRIWAVAERLNDDSNNRQEVLEYYQKKNKLVRLLNFSSGEDFKKFLEEEHPLLPESKRWQDFQLDFKFWYKPVDWPPPSKIRI